MRQAMTDTQTGGAEMEFAEQLKKARTELYMTQAEMAKLFGVTEQTIRRWEHGKSQPHIAAVRKLNEICKKNKIQTEQAEEKT